VIPLGPFIGRILGTRVPQQRQLVGNKRLHSLSV
jgi:hypothetical protein